MHGLLGLKASEHQGFSEKGMKRVFAQSAGY